ncbi:MAG: hypothetical protein LQ342_000864 [Letrouitia transgressa]|nr:MAG: hypothetical protein LQ342_000864 [Letrouitia transgressa]
MAKNLRAKLPESDTLVIFDQNPDVLTKFQTEVGIAATGAGASAKGTGITIAESSRDAAEKSEVVITVLPEPSHVANVFGCILHPRLPSIEPERLFIDCSTIDPTSSREIANAVHSSSQGRFVDAPMSGGVVGARASTLTFMLGASTRSGQLVDRVVPILELMGSKVLHLGEQGMGLSGKLANNYLLAISNIATAEAMNLGVRCGLDTKKLGELINGSSGQCWSSTVNNPVEGISPGAPAERDFNGGFAVGLMKKDLKLAMKAAAESGAQLELAQKAKEVYDAVGASDEMKDFSVVYQWLNSRNATT